MRTKGTPRSPLFIGVMLCLTRAYAKAFMFKVSVCVCVLANYLDQPNNKR